ncbi:MAG: hypothetical protein K8W52_04980, partial [Deltaproteobacteria bacterium]|nr:hypothetical protein [Deltaproteobacteria bacterium]
GAPRWAVGLGGLGADVARAIAVAPGAAIDGPADGKAVIAVAGYFDGEATFGALGARKSKGGTDAFVTALAADGTPRWVQTFGSGRDDVASGVAISKDGHVVVVGNFVDKMDVAGIKGQAANSDDLYAAAFKPDGSPEWLWTAGGIDSDGANCVAATPDGGWIIGGSFINEAKFGDTVFQSKGGGDAILARLEPTGKVRWVQQLGGEYNDAIRSVAVDADGNLYLLAEFVDTATFGGEPLKNTGNAGADLAIVKLDGNGKHLWSRNLGSRLSDVAGTITVDATGAVTVTGSFEGKLFAGSEQYAAVGQLDVLIAHYTADGTLAWVKTWGGEGTDIAGGVIADASGNLFVTGWYEGAVLFGKTALASKGNRDVFAVKLSAAGEVQWAESFGDHDHDQGRAIAIDAHGNPVITGVYRFAFDAVKPPLQSTRAPDDKLPKPDVFVLGLSK